MKVLIIGGSGKVGTWTIPYLQKQFELKILDVNPPKDQSIEFIEGSLTDPTSIAKALDGVDVFINMVMKNPTDPFSNRATIEDVVNNYEVNTLGLHLLLYIAQSMGITKGVHTSTFTVHARDRNKFSSEEEIPLDNPGVYGLTKGIGERICGYFSREYGMSIAALRITGPRNTQDWIKDRNKPKDSPDHLWVTEESDLASAYSAAINFVEKHTHGFESFFIAGDENEVEINLSKAKNLLGWTPKAHLHNLSI